MICLDMYGMDEYQSEKARILYKGEKIKKQHKTIEDGSFFMNETADLKNVLKGKLNIFVWIKDLLKAKSFNKFWIHDIQGSIIWYIK